MLEVIDGLSHLDHGLSPAHISWLLDQFKDRSSFFLETIELPAELSSIECGLYGPVMGDAVIYDEEVEHVVRGKRSCASRVVNRPLRPTRLVTIIAGPAEGKDCVVYTVYGGPAAPREPGDIGLSNWDDVMESRLFWNTHALSKPLTPGWIRTPADVDVFLSRVATRVDRNIDQDVMLVVEQELKDSLGATAPGALR